MNSEIIIFLSTVCSLIVGLIGLMVRYCFLSKCNKIRCFCCEIDRDIKHETSISDTNNNLNNNNLNNNLNNNNLNTNNLNTNSLNLNIV